MGKETDRGKKLFLTQVGEILKWEGEFMTESNWFGYGPKASEIRAFEVIFTSHYPEFCSQNYVNGMKLFPSSIS